MARGISLANKCQLLFGLAVVVIVGAALIVPWIRLRKIIDDAQLESSRQIADLWTQSQVVDPEVLRFLNPLNDEVAAQARRRLEIRWWPYDSWQQEEFEGGFLRAAQRLLAEQDDEAMTSGFVEHAESLWQEGDRVYRYARLVEGADADAPIGVVVIIRRSSAAADQLLINRMYLVLAGILAGGFAVLVFYLITTRIILSPVRQLKETADRVREGELQVRSTLKTGDEFEQLAEAFNSMLGNLSQQQQLLRGMNKSLEFQMGELEERNTTLQDNARLKGEFLANISHELRTPLNSIIGFAEILQDIAGVDEQADSQPLPPEQLAKRKRYLDNIVTAGRTLLEMINELLAMARIEAGNIEMHVQTVNVSETCEALLALIKPLTDRKRLNIGMELQSTREAGFTSDSSLCDLPNIETDQQKFHHVVFNFLSNAVKFTPDEGTVTIRADRIIGADGEPRIRVSVLDTGPGIPLDQQQLIFEKFSQLESGHTRTHTGTGLGLAIAQEFAELLQGEIKLVSDVGRGSMFSLVVPLVLTEVGSAVEPSA